MVWCNMALCSVPATSGNWVAEVKRGKCICVRKPAEQALQRRIVSLCDCFNLTCVDRPLDMPWYR